MAESIEVRGVVQASPRRVFEAWLDGELHGEMTGGGATSSPDGRFTAWDGYIQGRTLEAEEDRRIVQAWRTSEFPAEAKDSRLEVLLAPVAEGTAITLRHSNIPDGQGARYEQGWLDHYLTPMRAHFGG